MGMVSGVELVGSGFGAWRREADFPTYDGGEWGKEGKHGVAGRQHSSLGAQTFPPRLRTSPVHQLLTRNRTVSTTLPPVTRIISLVPSLLFVVSLLDLSGASPSPTCAIRNTITSWRNYPFTPCPSARAILIQSESHLIPNSIFTKKHIERRSFPNVSSPRAY